MQSYCLQRAGAAEHAEHVNVCVCVCGASRWWKLQCESGDEEG